MIARPERSAQQAPAVTTPLISSFIDVGRETCCSLDAASDREWLVTNDIGGFASGTVAGVITRRYHGILMAARDGAYHQGTVWGWLLGPFVLAHLRVYNDPVRAAAFLEPIANHLSTSGLGSVSEIFDGDAPFSPRGCIAQAWTVAEVLRAWTATAAASATARTKTPAQATEGQVERALRDKDIKINDARVRTCRMAEALNLSTAGSGFRSQKGNPSAGHTE